MSELIPEVAAIANDECSYIYYDKNRIGAYERESRFALVGRIVRSLAVVYVIIILFVSAILIVLSVAKLIPLASSVISIFIYVFIFVMTIGAYVIYNRRTNLENGLEKLVLRQQKQQLSSKDFYNEDCITRLSDGQNSPEDIPVALGIITAILSLLILRDVEMNTLFSFILWYAVLVLDSITFTVFNLVDYVKVMPKASGWVVTLTQIMMLATTGGRILSIVLSTHRGFEYIQGNKFKARKWFSEYVRHGPVFSGFDGDIFGEEEEMKNRAVFIEINHADRSNPVLRAMSLEQLDTEILQSGNKLINDIKRHLLDTGCFTEEFKIELSKILQPALSEKSQKSD